jgi:sec-independent protein translocase protein TatC
MKRKMQRHSSFFSSLLLFIGVLFGYYIVIPMSVNFVATFKVSDLVGMRRIKKRNITDNFLA